MKDNTLIIHVTQNGQSKRLASPREENFQTYEKDNNTNKKNCIYLEAFRMSTKQPQFFFLQLQSGIQLTEQQLSSYKLHQRQLKMKTKKKKRKRKQKPNYYTHI